MKKIKYQEIKCSILNESKFDLVVETNGRVHTGALFFKLDSTSSLGEIKSEIELPEEVSTEDFIAAIIEFYQANTEKVYEDTPKTIKHWFSMNGVGAAKFVFIPENYSKEITFRNRTFRYNKKSAVLEYLDSDKDVITSIGLRRENAEEGLEYWVENWSDDLDAEMKNELKYL